MVHDATIKSLWHQNNVATSFWLHNDVIIASRARWVQYSRSFGTLQVRSYNNKTSYWTLTLGHVSISNKTSYYKISQSFKALKFVNNNPWEKNWSPWLLTVSSRWIHGELTVTKMVTASRDWAATWAVIELWPSRDWAVIALTELWPSRDWAVTSPWLSCDLASPWLSRDHWAPEPWPPWAHSDNFFSHGNCLILYWNLAATSAAVLLKCLSNFEVICTF